MLDFSIIKFCMFYLVFNIIHRIMLNVTIVDKKANHKLEFQVSTYDTDVAPSPFLLVYNSYLKIRKFI